MRLTAMMAPLLLAMALDGTRQPNPGPPGIYYENAALCSLERPEVSTTFRDLKHLPGAPTFTMVLSTAARDFGISEESLLLIERRLGGIVLIDVPIQVSAIPERDGAYRVAPARELWADDYSFAIKRDSALVFFGCSFTTLP